MCIAYINHDTRPKGFLPLGLIYIGPEWVLSSRSSPPVLTDVPINLVQQIELTIYASIQSFLYFFKGQGHRPYVKESRKVLVNATAWKLLLDLSTFYVKLPISSLYGDHLIGFSARDTYVLREVPGTGRDGPSRAKKAR